MREDQNQGIASNIDGNDSSRSRPVKPLSSGATNNNNDDDDDKAEQATREQLKNASLANQGNNHSSQSPFSKTQPVGTDHDEGSPGQTNSSLDVTSSTVPPEERESAFANGQSNVTTSVHLSNKYRDSSNTPDEQALEEDAGTANAIARPAMSFHKGLEHSQDLNAEKVHVRSKGESSPRRKRSRDQLDHEHDREQKIAATEEARAQRLSSEVDRTSVEGNGPVVQNQRAEDQTSHQAKSVFGTVNTVTQAGLRSEASQTPATSAERSPSSSAFASSGFAALASSSASPFGAFTGPQYSGSVFLEQKPSSKDAQAKHADSALPRSSPFFAVNQSGSSSSSVFGGSQFNQGFDRKLGTGAKLTSFAAAKGDANLGASSSAVKPLGSSKEVSQSDQNIDSEEDGGEEFGKDQPSLEEDERFHSQDVETGEDGEETLFASRASLFSFRTNAWKESGKGIFKFNIASNTADESAPKTGRFIMRAHQTFRVLLNAPVFREMKVGDSRGNEPTGKSFAFAVIEDGKPIPHMVKLSDTAESKSLYSAVRDLQRHLGS